MGGGKGGGFPPRSAAVPGCAGGRDESLFVSNVLLHSTLGEVGIFVAAFVELGRVSIKVSTKAATKVVKVTQSAVQ